MKKFLLMFVMILVIYNLMGNVVLADGDHACAHFFYNEPDFYDVTSSGHTPYYLCMYCGHTDIGSLETHNDNNSIYVKVGEENLCYINEYRCDVCDFLDHAYYCYTHAVPEFFTYYEDRGNANTHVRINRCICGWEAETNETHSFSGSTCFKCGYTQ